MKHLCLEGATRFVRFRVPEFGMKTHWTRFLLYDPRMSQDISILLIRVGSQIACFAQTDKQVHENVIPNRGLAARSDQFAARLPSGYWLATPSWIRKKPHLSTGGAFA